MSNTPMPGCPVGGIPTRSPGHSVPSCVIFVFFWLTLCGANLALPTALVAVERSVSADAASPPKSRADLKALEQKIQTMVARVSPSVISVSGGSGVVISDDGYVLTVAHVGQRAGRRVVVLFPDGRRARAVTLGNDQGADAGMVKITDPGPWPHAPMTTSKNLRPGQWCVTMGYPVMFEHGKPAVVRIGRVLHNERLAVITDGTIMGGDSGAPLFDLEGKIIAIGTKCDASLTYNMHVPLDRFSDVWNRLLQSEDFDSQAPKPMLGVVPAEIAGDTRLGSIVPGSGADRAGLKPGDVLVSFDGHEVGKYAELPPLVERHKPGDKVEVKLRRRDEALTLSVTLGKRDPGEEK